MVCVFDNSSFLSQIKYMIGQDFVADMKIPVMSEMVF